MRRREFLKRYSIKLSVALLLIGIIVYTVFHAIGGSAGSLMTTPARTVTDTRILGGEAYLFREETLLDQVPSGLVEDLVQNGSKVGKDVCLARVWTDCDPAQQKELDRLNRLIGVLEAGHPEAGEPAIHARQYKQEADSLALQIKQARVEGRESEIPMLEDRMMINLCRAAILTGKGAEVTQTLNDLKQQRQTLLTGFSIPVYNSQASGYFYNRSYIDGGEGIFTSEALSGLTAEGLQQLRQQFSDSSAGAFTVGKMIYRYDWRIALVYDTPVEGLLTAGDAYEVVFSENEDKELTLVCERVEVDENGRTLVVLYCNQTPTDFHYLRTQHVEIRVGECRGYYIPEQALTVQNGVDGVFIFENSTVYFRRIDILYRGDGYCIAAERAEQGEDYLSLNDIIVTAGKDLYDGRVYQ